MTIIRTALIAASFVTVFTTAHAQVRDDIGGSLHGNTPAWTSSPISGEARGAFGKASGVRGRIQMQSANPLLDSVHGN